jgi:hypothetical protein
MLGLGVQAQQVHADAGGVQVHAGQQCNSFACGVDFISMRVSWQARVFGRWLASERRGASHAA